MKPSKMLKNSFRVLIAAFFILVALSPLTASAAGPYYVDNTNASCSDSGSGTLAAPFCTITKGESMTSAGTTVYVLAGTYAESVFVSHSGTSGSPITFQAGPGVIVSGSTSGGGNGFYIVNQAYVVIDGFTVSYTKGKGILVSNSNHITISNNHISHAGNNAAADDPHKQGIDFDTTTDSVITGNTTDHNTCIGIRLRASSNNNTISNNISYANSSASIVSPEFQISDAAGIELLDSDGNTVIHNLTYGNEDTGINLYASDTGDGSSNNYVLGNLSYGNGDHGIDNYNSPNNVIVGNTVQGNVTAGIQLEGTTGSAGGTIMNNIMVDNGLLNITGGTPNVNPGNLRVDGNSTAGTVADYNIYYLSGGTYQIIWGTGGGAYYPTLAAFKATHMTQEVNGLEANPLLVSPASVAIRTYPNYATLPKFYSVVDPEPAGNFHLSSGSPAIDSANSGASGEPVTDIEGNSRVDDPATANTGIGTRTYDDRGAYEYQLGAPIAPVVTTQAVTDIGGTSATGNGNIVSLGFPSPTQHGVVWSTSPNPTIAGSKTTDGPVSATGPFTSAITGLTPGMEYHVRAYATNNAGTSYGSDVIFTAVNLVQITEIFNSSGSWVAGEGTNSVTVEVWGGGGRGGSISGGSGEVVRGGGGGGAYSIKANIPVTPGGSYDYVVGTGSNNTAPGGDSYFIDPTIVLAKGGSSSNTSAGAVGGLAATGVGDTKYSGGNGANGNTQSNYGGGGGSSAGTGSNGTNATNQNGANAPSGGGDGGDGRSSPSGSGSAGSVPGGAGGGAYRRNGGGSYSGGDGADGRIRITYLGSPKSTTTSVDCGAGTPVVTYGSNITCVATVTVASGSASPTGNVSWTTDGSGAFVTSPCTLSGTGGSATCSVTYTPGAVGTATHKITATYAGESPFIGSSGHQNVTVNQKALTVTGITANNKVYDGTTAATLNLGSATLVGVVGTDVVSLVTSAATGTFDTKDAGTGKTVTITGLIITGANMANYTLTQPTTTADITAKELTVTGIIANNKVYDRTTVATLNLAGATLVGRVDSEDVTLNTTGAAGAFADKNVGTGKTVTISGLSLNGTAKGNYTLTQPTATANITAKALSVTATGVNKEYDGTPTATVTLNDDRISGDVLVLSYTAANFDTKNIGTGKTVSVTGINVTGADSGNYTFNTSTSTTANITAKALTVTGITADNKIYNGNTVATLVLGGATLNGKVTGEDVTLNTASATGTFEDKNVGNGKTVTVAGLSLDGADKGNYTVTQPTTTANITKAALTVTATGNNKTYDGTTVAIVNLTDNRFAGDVLSLSYAAASFDTKDVGTGKTVSVTGINVTGTDAGNYTWNTSTVTSANITKAALTVSATGVNKTYDGLTNATVNLSDNRFGSDVLVLSYGSASFDTKDVGTGKTVSVTGIDVTGADAGNYTWNTTASTTANITKATAILLVTNSPVITTHSPQDAQLEATYLEIVVSGTFSNVKYDGSSTVPSEPGTYAITADFTPDDTTNYVSLTDASAGDFVILYGVYLPLAMK